MDTHPSPLDALRNAVTNLNGQSATARLLKVSQSAVWKWLNVTRELPPQHVLQVEAATGVSRHHLRPDIYPVEHACSPSTWIAVSDREALVTFPNRAVPQRDTSTPLRYGAAR